LSYTAGSLIHTLQPSKTTKEEEEEEEEEEGYVW